MSYIFFEFLILCFYACVFLLILVLGKIHDVLKTWSYVKKEIADVFESRCFFLFSWIVLYCFSLSFHLSFGMFNKNRVIF